MPKKTMAELEADFNKMRDRVAEIEAYVGPPSAETVTLEVLQECHEALCRDFHARGLPTIERDRVRASQRADFLDLAAFKRTITERLDALDRKAETNGDVLPAVDLLDKVIEDLAGLLKIVRPGAGLGPAQGIKARVEAVRAMLGEVHVQEDPKP